MTKSEDYLKRIIYHFLTLSKAGRDETSIFKTLRHNDDLCPGLSERIETILSYLKKYREISYDIQGTKDEGSDVILRYYVDKKVHFICFQMKSYEDLKDRDYLRKLKAQYVDSRKRFDFEDYYIILATDKREARDKIRLIKAELSTIQEVTIIDPFQFLFFWRLKSAQVGAIIKSFVDEGDLLIQRALERVAGLFKTHYCLIFFILDLSIRKGFLSAIDIDAILFSKYLREVYETFPIEEIKDGEYMYSLDRSHYDSKDFEKMVKRDLDFLNEKYFNTDFENNRIIVDYDYLKPIICLILEAQIKYEFNTQETVEYLEQLVLSIWV